MYLECLSCPKLGTTCKGPNFVAMPAHDLWEWCKKRKAQLHLTNQQLADMSGTPKGTIDRLFAKDQADFKYETIRPLIRVLVGGEFDDVTCQDPQDQQMDERAADTIKHLEEENARLKENNEEYKSRIHFLREQVASKDRLLQERYAYLALKDKYIRILASLLVPAVLFIIGLLIVDAMNPDMGFFWRSVADHFTETGTGTNEADNLLYRIINWRL